MKKLTKAIIKSLLLTIGFLPLVSFADDTIFLPKMNYITDDNGNRHQDNRFDVIYSFKNGYANVGVGKNLNALTPNQEDIRNAKWGVIDKTGKIIIPLKKHFINDYVPNIGFVFSIIPDGQERGKFGLYNKNGNVIIPPIYDNYLEFNERLSVFEKDGKFGYGDMTGKIVISLKYQDATKFINGKAFVKTDNHYQMIDKQNNVLKSYTFDSLFEYNKDLYIISQGDRQGIMTVDGIIKTPPIYDYVGAYFDDKTLTSFKQNGKWGFMDKNAEIVIPAQYEDAKYFENGLVAVKKQGKVGFIDVNNKIIIPFIYDAPKPNLGDFDMELFNKENEIYNTYQIDENNTITLIKNGKWGVIDKNNKVLIDFKYDRIQMKPSWLPVKVTKNGKTFEIPNPLATK